MLEILFLKIILEDGQTPLSSALLPPLDFETPIGEVFFVLALPVWPAMRLLISVSLKN